MWAPHLESYRRASVRLLPGGKFQTLIVDGDAVCISQIEVSLRSRQALNYHRLMLFLTYIASRRPIFRAASLVLRSSDT